MPNPFAHIELTTDDTKQAAKFYQTLFQWKLRPMPAMNYTMIDVGGGTGGGMQKKPMPEAPTAWLAYVSVDDVKKTLAKARKAGATIALDYTPIGDMGAIGVFIDPAGASLGVWEPGKGAAAAPPPSDEAMASARPAKKAPAKKAPAKKAAAKAPPAKKAPAKKAPAKKSAKKG